MKYHWLTDNELAYKHAIFSDEFSHICFCDKNIICMLSIFFTELFHLKVKRKHSVLESARAVGSRAELHAQVQTTKQTKVKSSQTLSKNKFVQSSRQNEYKSEARKACPS